MQMSGVGSAGRPAEQLIRQHSHAGRDDLGSVSDRRSARDGQLPSCQV